MPAYQNPPWVMFKGAQEGYVDILPAMRSGSILQNVPEALARILVEAANNYGLYPPTVALEFAGNEFDEINPGIKKTVLWLRSLGFETTDSGDGVTHDHACDLPYPYVNISVIDNKLLLYETDRLRLELWNKGIQIKEMSGDETQPFIQMTYDPANRKGFIQLGNVKDDMFDGEI